MEKKTLIRFRVLYLFNKDGNIVFSYIFKNVEFLSKKDPILPNFEKITNFFKTILLENLKLGLKKSYYILENNIIIIFSEISDFYFCLIPQSNNNHEYSNEIAFSLSFLNFLNDFFL